MVCCQTENKVHTCPPQGAQQPLTKRIGLRTLGQRFEDSESKMAYVGVELRRENAIPIMQEETVGVIRWDGCAQLLQCP